MLALAWTAAATPARAGLPDHPALSVAPVPSWAEVADVMAMAAVSPASATSTTGVQDHAATSRPEDEPREPSDDDAETAENTDSDEVRSVRILLDDSQVRLPAAGPADTFYRFAYRLETRSALEDWSSWQTEFAPDYQRLELHFLRIGRDGTWLDRSTDSQASILQREAGLESQMYHDSRTLVVVLDDVRVGDIVDIAWTVRGANPVFGGRYFSGFTLQTGQHHDLLRVSVDFPDRRNVAYRLSADGEAPDVWQAGGRTRLTWESRGELEIDYEGWVPSGIYQFPWVQLSEYTSWSQVLAWALPYYRLEPEPAELEALRTAAGLDGAASEDPWRRLAAARTFVQDDVRYFAQLMGPHSHAPHLPADVLRRRYGDCKDKSFLLVHLLAALDLEAWPVLVHSREGGVLPDRLPSPGIFDHAIVGVAMPGETVFLDATMRLQGGVERVHVPDYGWGLELRPGVEALSRIQASAAAAGSTEVTYEYDVASHDVNSRVVITTVYRGGDADAQRDYLDGMDPAETLENYVSYYTSDLHRPTAAAPLEVSDDRETNEIRIVETYDLEYLPAPGDPTTFETLPLQLDGRLPSLEVDDGPETEEDGDAGAERGAFTEPGSRGRRHPLSLPHPVHLIETLVIKTENQLNWDVSGDEVDRPWLHFGVEAGQKGRTMKARLELQTLARSVPPEEITDYLEVLAQVQDNLGYHIRTVNRDEEFRSLALTVLTSALCLLSIGAFASALVQHRRGLL